MGLTSNEFKDRQGNSFHFEIKGSCIVLWNEDESIKLMDLDYSTALDMYKSLVTHFELAYDQNPYDL